jgi:hypothetical protein
MEQRIESATTPRLVSRRTLIGSAAGVAAVAIAGAGYAAAQESTPEEATEEAADATLLERSAALIALIEADHATVAADVDVATADQLLGFAHDLLDQATGATPPDEDAAEAQDRLAVGAGVAALAARSTLLAELSPGSLPSQQAPVSRQVAATHARITESSRAVADSGVTEAAMALDIAQDLYTAAYNAYTAGSYAEARHLDQASTQMLRAALILSAELPDHRFIDMLDGADGQGNRPSFFRRNRRERRDERLSLDAWMTLVEVPAP